MKAVPPWYVNHQSFQSLSRVQLFATPWTAAHQASLSITNSRSLLKLMSIESVIPSNRLILCRPLLLLPSIFPSIGIFSNTFTIGENNANRSAFECCHVKYFASTLHSCVYSFNIRCFCPISQIRDFSVTTKNASLWSSI